MVCLVANKARDSLNLTQGSLLKLLVNYRAMQKKIKEFFCSSVLNEKGIMPVITPVKP